MRKSTPVDPLTTRLHTPAQVTPFTKMRKITTVDPVTRGLHTFTQVNPTTNRLYEIISSKKDDRYSTPIYTKRFDTSTSQFTEMKPKTNLIETEMEQKTTKSQIFRTKTSASSYQITFTPNQVIVKEIPGFMVSLASIPSAILACLVLFYLLIKCKKIIKKQRLLSRQGRIVRDSGMIEMSSVINEQYMPSPER